MRLTDNHLTMLWEMAEIHFQCFEKFYMEYSITYQEVLEMNHRKMLDIAIGFKVSEEENLTFIFESIIRDYKKMLARDIPKD